MVRNYVRKTGRGTGYTKENLVEAVDKVKNKVLTAYRASIAYNIPRATIVARVHGKYGLKSDTLGRSPVIPKATEESLAQSLHQMEKYGFGLSRKEIIELVGHYVVKNNIQNPFTNDIPGEDWFLAFKKRHNLSVKKPQAVENSRKKACNPWTIYTYFDLLEKTMDELGLHDKPSQIWNLDETSFSKDPCKTKVVGLKGYAATRTIASPGKSNTTVLLGCSAAGDKTPPLIIFKGKDIWDEWTSKEDYPGTVYAATKNGWMETDVFETFFEKVFLPTVGTTRPILLLYDGHSTHVGLNIIEKAREANITILKIPPHTSDNLQPLDLSVNKSFKDKWDQSLVKWQRRHVGQSLPKKDFAKLIGEIWAQIEPKVCEAGFRKAGIFPFNSNAVPEEKFNSNMLAEWKKHLHRSTELNEINASIQRQPQNRSVELSPGPSCSKDFSKFETIMQSTSVANFSVPDPLSFPSLLSICLKNLNGHYKERTSEQNDTDINTNKKKIHIIEDRLVTFEELLLEKIQAGAQNKHKRTRIACGAEIITSEEVFMRQKSIEEEKLKKIRDKEERKIKKMTNIKIPGTSKEKKRVKKSNVEIETMDVAEVKNGNEITNPNEFVDSQKNKKRNTKRKTTEKSKTRKLDDSTTSESDIEMELNDETDLEDLEYYQGQGIEDDGENSENLFLYRQENEYIDCKKEERKPNKVQKKNTMNMKPPIEKKRLKTNESKIGSIYLEEEDSKKETKKPKTFHTIQKMKNSKTTEKRKTKRKNDSTTCKSNIEMEFNDETDLEDIEYDQERAYDIENVVLDREENESDDYDEPPTSTVVTGQWVLVKFATKTSVKYYVGVVTEINSDGLPTVKYVRKSTFRGGDDRTAFTFPHVPDVCVLRHLQDIECKLPNPMTDRRGKMFFKMSFQGFNVQ